MWDAKAAGQPPPQLPQRSVTVRAWSAAKAYAQWAVAGCPRPTDEEVAERKAACDACPHLRNRDSGEKRCGLCGCPINKVAHLFGTVERPGKAEMSTEVCPDNPPRWKNLL